VAARAPPCITTGIVQTKERDALEDIGGGKTSRSAEGKVTGIGDCREERKKPPVVLHREAEGIVVEKKLKGAERCSLRNTWDGGV